MNCWQFQKCPDERRNACKAYPKFGLDCWKVTGTMCKGVQQGTQAQKLAFCRVCNFYKEYAHKF